MWRPRFRNVYSVILIAGSNNNVVVFYYHCGLLVYCESILMFPGDTIVMLVVRGVVVMFLCRLRC